MQTMSRGAHVQTRLRLKGGTYNKEKKKNKKFESSKVAQARRKSNSKKKSTKIIEQKKGKKGEPSQLLGLRKTSSASHSMGMGSWASRRKANLHSPHFPLFLLPSALSEFCVFRAADFLKPYARVKSKRRSSLLAFSALPPRAARLAKCRDLSPTDRPYLN